MLSWVGYTSEFAIPQNTGTNWRKAYRLYSIVFDTLERVFSPVVDPSKAITWKINCYKY